MYVDKKFGYSADKNCFLYVNKCGKMNYITIFYNESPGASVKIMIPKAVIRYIYEKMVESKMNVNIDPIYRERFFGKWVEDEAKEEMKKEKEGIESKRRYTCIHRKKKEQT